MTNYRVVRVQKATETPGYCSFVQQTVEAEAACISKPHY